MTQQKEIEEAVKVLHKIISDGFWNETVYDSHRLCRIKDLAKRYLEIEGFPEEMNGDNVGGVHFRSGYNYCLERCKLALLKKMDGIEDVIANTNCHIPEIGRRMKDSFHPSLIENLAQAIKVYLTK